jgi:CheY-like chemotaxis protein
MTILYIDDDLDDAYIMKEALQYLDKSIECITFDKCVEAIDYLLKVHTLPDYIFLDINMPQMNGKECLIRIKEEQRLKHIPIVMCSTAFQTKEMKSYFDLGVHDFIVKPNNLETFYTNLSSILQPRAIKEQQKKL